MRIVILIAGTNDPSNCETLADAFAEGMRERGGSIEKIRIRELTIGHFTLECYRPDYPHEPDMIRVEESLLSCDGFVIATPIWNFSVPAHLKNLIDRMGVFGLDEATRSKGTLNGTPFYLLITGGAPVAAWKGLMRMTMSHLSQAFLYFGGSYIGHCFEGRCMRGKGEFGLVVDKRPESLGTARERGREFATVVESFIRTGKPPLWHRVRSAVAARVEGIIRKLR